MMKKPDQNNELKTINGKRPWTESPSNKYITKKCNLAEKDERFARLLEAAQHSADNEHSPTPLCGETAAPQIAALTLTPVPVPFLPFLHGCCCWHLARLQHFTSSTT